MSDIDFDLLRPMRPPENPSVEEVRAEAQVWVDGLESILAGGLGFTEGLVVSFDQSLANTGYVVVDYDRELGVSIVEMGNFNTKSHPDKTSWDDTFDRAVQLFDSINQLLVRVRPKIVLHETPPVGSGPKMRRTDSSIVTATVIRCSTKALYIPTDMVSAQAVKGYLTGNRNAQKKEVRKVLEKRFETELQVPGLRKNEHTFDALGIVVTYMHVESQ